MKATSWMSTRQITEARKCLRECPDADARSEGLACLQNAQPEYLSSLMKNDHPDRRAALQWLEENC